MPNVDRGAGRPRRGAEDFASGTSRASGGGRRHTDGSVARRAVARRAVALSVLLGLGGAASAEAAVLVLGVHTEQQLLPRARAQVAQHLSRMGETTRDPSLSSNELLCTERACLERLARSYRAERLVGGEILPNDRNYLVRMWLYDAVAQQPASSEDRCVECTAEQAYELAARVTGRLLDAAAAPAAPAAPASPDQAPAALPPVPAVVPPPDQAQSPAQSPAASPEPPAPPLHDPLATPPQRELQPSAARPAPGRPGARCVRRVYTFGRGVAVGALGALTAAGLATAIGLHAGDGSVYLPYGSPGDGGLLPATVNHDFSASYRLAYGLTAVTALGLAAALVPWHKLVPPPGVAGDGGTLPMCPASRSRWTFNRGLLVGALGSLLVGGLVMAAATHALDGGTTLVEDVRVPYRFQSVYTAGYVASGALALGLGVTLLWP